METEPTNHHPAWVHELESEFGSANQNAFGTAVFYEQTADGSIRLEELAQKWYQYFCGPNWERFGPENWLGTWKRVGSNSPKMVPLVDELTNLEDAQARLSGLTMLDGRENPSTAKRALSRAFDTPAIEERQIYSIGDGGAMSGLLIAGHRSGGENVFLAFLLD